MLTTTKDLLYITISASIALLTFFICLGLYYLIMIIRDTAQTTKDIKERLNAMWRFCETVKAKIYKAADGTTVVTKTIFELIDYIQAKKSKKTKRGG